jgi:hypothetical protein
MKEVSFNFRGKHFRGFIAVSKEEFPHYYWCFLDDPELVKEVGDCITFKMDMGDKLQPAEPYPNRYHDLVQVIRDIVEKQIAANTFA